MKQGLEVLWRGWGLAVLLLAGPGAWAHKVSDSFLKVKVEREVITGRWAMALHDLELAVGLDANGDGAITWGELKAKRDGVVEYAGGHLGLTADGGELPIRFQPDLQVEALANGTYAVLTWESRAAAEPGVLALDYRLFFEEDRLHRGLLLLEHRGRAQEAVFNPLQTRLRLDLEKPEPWREFGRFVREGAWHIGIGYDHILFLVVLLLPAVLRREKGVWVAVGDLRAAFVGIVKVVTAFTIAHSVTLSLAALQIVRLPSRWVESAIAASIIVAAMNNLWPVRTGKNWGIAFVFGLVHGFGFASVLGELGLPPGSLARALVGFNLGVEAGQLLIVVVFLPVAYWLRAGAFYRGVVLRGGSGLAAVLAGGWLVQRLGGG